MKSRVIIHMGASKHTVTVQDASGNPVVFDLFAMTKDQRRQFHREFMKAYRAS